MAFFRNSALSASSPSIAAKATRKVMLKRSLSTWCSFVRSWKNNRDLLRSSCKERGWENVLVEAVYQKTTKHVTWGDLLRRIDRLQIVSKYLLARPSAEAVA